MVLTIRRFVTRIFGTDDVEQRFTVLSPQNTPEWEHYFPRQDRRTTTDEATERDQSERSRPALTNHAN